MNLKILRSFEQINVQGQPGWDPFQKQGVPPGWESGSGKFVWGTHFKFVRVIRWTSTAQTTVAHTPLER